jgi:hypothetical protein
MPAIRSSICTSSIINIQRFLKYTSNMVLAASSQSKENALRHQKSVSARIVVLYLECIVI